jgi:hypothetical protein
MNGGTVRARMNIKAAAELLHSSDHSWDANPHAKRLPALMSGGFLRSLPVIADDQAQSLAHTPEIDGDSRRGGVPMHVGQGLLDNAE